MATLNPLHPIAPWRLLPGMVCLDRDEFDTSGGGNSNDEDDDEDDEDDENDEPDKKADKSKKSDDNEDDDDDENDDEKDLDEKAKGILRKNRKEARQAKARAKRAEEALEALKKGKGGKSDDDDRDREKEAEARGAKRGTDIAIRASVRAELLAAGLNVGEDKSRALKRAMRLIDFEDLSIDDDGAIDGLDDAIDELREEMPSLFAKPKKRRSNINGEDSRSGGKPTPKSASERQAAALAKG